MKEKYFQFYLPTETQIASLWSEALFVFDTNVLFNLYRYSSETSKEFIETIHKLKDRVWLPFQVGYEFHRNRISVINEEIKIYKDYNKKFEDFWSDIDNKNRNPFFSKELSKNFAQLRELINNETTSKINEYEKQLDNDSILDKLLDIYSVNVGEEYNQEKLDQIYKQGEQRYKDDIPPGFEDKKKPTPEKFGDLIIWNQIIDKAVESKKPIIFVTDDGKEDWWWIISGKTISARPELMKEFSKKTSQNCHFYKPFQFLKYSNEYLGSKVKSEVIQEVKDFKMSNIDLNINNYTLKIRLRCLYNDRDLMSLVNTIESDGYEMKIDSDELDHVFTLSIKLPTIPDLKRRFIHKYITNMDNNLFKLIELIGISPNEFE